MINNIFKISLKLEKYKNRKEKKIIEKAMGRAVEDKVNVQRL